MAELVRDIMNHDLLSLRPTDSVETARNAILSLGVTAAPVLDTEQRPIGIVSLRDLSDEPLAESVTRRMKSPVVTANPADSVDAVASRLAESSLRHLVVVDGRGCAVGMVSASDVLRGLLGMQPKHPPAFPQETEAPSDVPWSGHFALEVDAVLARAPVGAGILELSIENGARCSPIWIEETENLRSRLTDILEMPLELNTQLRSWIERELLHLRFRFASIGDRELRTRSFEALRRTLYLC